MTLYAHLHLRPAISRLTLYLAAVIVAAILNGCASEQADEQQQIGKPPVLNEQWQTISLGDHKMGYRHIIVEQDHAKLKRTDTLTVTLSQPGVHDQEISTTLIYHETPNGKPIALSKTITSETANHQMSAIIAGDSLELKIKQNAEPEYFPIPQPFYLPEGLRMALLKQRGTNRDLTYFSWNFSTRQFDKIQLRTAPYTDTEHPDYAWHIARSTGIGENTKYSDIFTDDKFNPLTERSHSNGEDVLIASCDKSCATASFIPNTHVYRQLIQSPYKITDTALNGKIRYHLSGDFNLTPPNTNEQRVENKPEGLDIIVCKDCGTEAPPSDTDLNIALQSNYWLPAQNPIFKNIIAEILADNDSNTSGKMHRLTRYVTRHMSEEPSYSGYATALEAYNSKQGDCTEHALLLATLARAAQIPARVVFGLAYTNDRFLGRKYVFVPHAWAQVWTGEKWESYDSGLGDFTAGYIALGLSNGDQGDILKINEQLHKISITSAIQIRSR